jgi:hypothetical protein
VFLMAAVGVGKFCRGFEGRYGGIGGIVTFVGRYGGIGGIVTFVGKYRGIGANVTWLCGKTGGCCPVSKRVRG